MITHLEAGRRLKAARLSTGLSQTAAAQQLGMPREQLSQLEAGRRVCLWPRLVEIVTTLGLDPRAVVPEFFADGR